MFISARVTRGPVYAFVLSRARAGGSSANEMRKRAINIVTTRRVGNAQMIDTRALSRVKHMSLVFYACFRSWMEFCYRAASARSYRAPIDLSAISGGQSEDLSRGINWSWWKMKPRRERRETEEDRFVLQRKRMRNFHWIPFLLRSIIPPFPENFATGL
jgi:hypothetical protein